MGQKQSSQVQDFLTNSFAKLTQDEPGEKSLILEDIQAMTYDDFIDQLSELNRMSQKCLDSSGTRLLFAVRKGTDSTVFWKGTIQVACVKLNEDSNTVNTYRLLNLKEFVQVYKNLKCQYTAVEQSGSTSAEGVTKLTASTLLNNLESDSKASKSVAETQGECIICFERKPDVLLPCAHSYCVQCIEEWNEDHDTCPICREKLESTDDTWVLPEVPKAEEISEEIRTTLMDLAKDDTPLCNPS